MPPVAAHKYAKVATARVGGDDAAEVAARVSGGHEHFCHADPPPAARKGIKIPTADGPRRDREEALTPEKLAALPRQLAESGLPDKFLANPLLVLLADQGRTAAFVAGLPALTTLNARWRACLRPLLCRVANCSRDFIQESRPIKYRGLNVHGRRLHRTLSFYKVSVHGAHGYSGSVCNSQRWAWCNSRGDKGRLPKTCTRMPSRQRCT